MDRVKNNRNQAGHGIHFLSPKKETFLSYPYPMPLFSFLCAHKKILPKGVFNLKKEIFTQIYLT